MGFSSFWGEEVVTLGRGEDKLRSSFEGLWFLSFWFLSFSRPHQPSCYLTAEELSGVSLRKFRIISLWLNAIGFSLRP